MKTHMGLVYNEDSLTEEMIGIIENLFYTRN